MTRRWLRVYVQRTDGHAGKGAEMTVTTWAEPTGQGSRACPLWAASTCGAVADLTLGRRGCVAGAGWRS